MEIEIDRDVRAVLEFMQGHVPAAKLVATAQAIGSFAPLLWGHHLSVEVEALRLRNPTITSLDDQRTQSSSTEQSLG